MTRKHKKTRGLLKEFKDFAVRGNVIDMAVGVIIGSAFGQIISSLVSDIIMPPIGLLIGGVHFDKLTFVLKKAVVENGVEIAPAVAIGYGSFLQASINFLIIAFCVFMFVKGINTLKRSLEHPPEPEPETPVEPSNEEKLLTEIRDLLKEHKKE